MGEHGARNEVGVDPADAEGEESSPLEEVQNLAMIGERRTREVAKEA